MKKGEFGKRIVLTAVALGLLLFFSAGAVRADELSDLKQQIEAATKMMQEMQERMAQFEARQKIKEQSLTERLDNVEKKTVEIEKAAPAGLPTSASWVERIKWSGDFRYRHESIDEETTGSVRWKDGRNRHRIRARLMLEAVLNDEWGVGFRLASGSGDPTSTNQTLDSSFSAKNIWLDLAYFDYHPQSVAGLNIYGGKMKNPFYMVGGNQLIFDGDVTPEGIAFTLERPLNDRNTLRLAGGGFWVDEGSGGTADPSLFGAQAMITHLVGKQDKVSAGLSYYDFGGIQGYGSLPATWGGSGFLGNSNSGGLYTNDYDVFEVFGEYATKCGDTPLSFFGSWIKNVAATSSEDTGWLIGTKVNKAADPGSWEASYMYRDIQADATVGALNDSDFIGGGTDGKGHTFGLTYQVSKNVQAAVTYFLNEDRANTAGRSLDYRRLQADLLFKFK
jgi:hypothetical protein